MPAKANDPLSCPHCGQADTLATIEHLTGYAGATLSVGKDGAIAAEHDGYTDVFWDGSKTVGYWCKDCHAEIGEQELLATAPAPKAPPTPPTRGGSLQDALGRSVINRRNTELAREFLGRSGST